MSTRKVTNTVQRFAVSVPLPERIKAILFITPLSVFYIPFLILPTIMLMGMSLFSGTTFQTLEFVGLANYEFLFARGTIWLALQNSLIYSIGHTVLGVGGGLLIAMALLKSYSHIQKYLRFLYMLPLAMMGVAVGFTWGYIYNPRDGVLIAIAEMIDPDVYISILGNPDTALLGIIAIGGWRGIGFYSVIWVIALLNVDERYYEVAKLDNVGAWPTFRYITLPLTKSIGMFLVLHSMIGSMKMFAYFWVLTEGGPAGATEVLITYMYKLGVKQSMLGRGAAVGVFLFLAVLVMTIGIERVFGLEPEWERGVQ